MIFNDKYNKIIELITKSSEEVKTKLEKFIDLLPEKALKKCKKVKNFGLYIDRDNYIDLSILKEKNINESIGLSLDNEKENIHFLLTINETEEKQIKELPLKEKNLDLFFIDLGELSIEKQNHEITYDFELNKIENDIYEIKVIKTINKVIDNKLIHEKSSTSKTYTYNELIELLHLKSNKR